VVLGSLAPQLLLLLLLLLLDVFATATGGGFVEEELARQLQQRLDSGEPLPPEEEFLRTNRAKAKVVTLPSGLQYTVLRKGGKAGASPGPNDECAVHYRGTLITHREFDGTRRTLFGFPAMFAPAGVIGGWREALELMREGDRWQLVIPAHLAYGQRGA
jgi:FKBP-type peptidyl-prolyl cis-trans isomerase